ncbi:MAG: ATP-binding protein [Proteobacteria bacterium]|nr:ATP-binding protein [Pseudomonadota bacterium]
MENPFSFTSFARTPAFCNRHKEQMELKSLIQNSQNVLLYSHRRLGKSSLILKVFEDLPDITSVYIDLYGTTSIDEFIKAVFKGISAVETKLDRLMKLIRQKINSISINFSIDPITGSPVASPALTPFDKTPVIEEVFGLIESLSAKKKMVIAFDEFQEVSKYESTAFEKLLRKHIQHHHRVSYIFAGSQKHLLIEMFSDSKRAFYKQAASFPLRKIDKAEYFIWIEELFLKKGYQIEYKMIDLVIEKCESHPMYIQEFF